MVVRESIQTGDFSTKMIRRTIFGEFVFVIGLIFSHDSHNVKNKLE